MKIKCLFLTVATFLFLFVGCNKDEEFEPFPDVFYNSIVKSVITDNNVVYSIELYLKTYATLKEVNAITPEGTYDLSDNLQYSGKTTYGTPCEIYKTMVPLAIEPSEGSCIFNVRFSDGREKTVFSSINKPYLIPAKNINITIHEGYLILKWDDVENADYYEIYSQVGDKKVFQGKTDKCEMAIDASEFSNGDPFDIISEIYAYHVKGIPENVSSISLAQIKFHVNEFSPWWTF